MRRLHALEIAHTPIAPTLFARLLVLPRRTMVHVHVAQAIVPEIVWITSKLRRRPYVAHFHLDVDPSGAFGRLLGPYKTHVLARVLRGAASVIALSDDQAEFLRATYAVADARIRVIPNGVTPGFTAERAYEARPDGPLRVLFVGRVGAQKNVPRLIEASRLVTSPLELVVVGDGTDRSRVESELSDLDRTTVRFVGTKRGTDLRQWYEWADVFVLPSDREGLPLSLLDAMAMGLPVVVTAVPGLEELCSGFGVVTEPSPEAVAAALDHLAEHPEERQRLSQLSLERARQFEWSSALDRIESLYAEAVR